MTLLAAPQALICLRSAARSSTLVSIECEARYRHMSSAYPNLRLLSIESSSARYSVYSTGVRGEPWGVPHATG
jgi:hypothetical protein